MAKGYWIVRLDIADMDSFKLYQAANAEALHKYGGRFLVRGGKQQREEGAVRSRHVVVEFKDYETAVACYHSPEYKRTIPMRESCSQADFLIIEGYDGPQP